MSKSLQTRILVATPELCQQIGLVMHDKVNDNVFTIVNSDECAQMLEQDDDSRKVEKQSEEEFGDFQFE